MQFFGPLQLRPPNSISIGPVVSAGLNTRTWTTESATLMHFFRHVTGVQRSIKIYKFLWHDHSPSLPLATCLVIPRVHDATGRATGWTTSCIDIRSFTVTSSHDCCSVRLLSLRLQSRISSTYSLNDILRFLKRYFYFRNFDVCIAVSNVHGTTVARTMT